MPFRWLKPALLSLGILLLLALAPAELPTGEVPAHTASLAGQLLIAAPDMGDPRFRHAVILIVMHNGIGAFGIMINRPLGERPFTELLEAAGQDSTGITGTVRIFAGGPVEPERGFVVHSADYHRVGTIDIDHRVAMTLSPGILRDIARKQGPAKSLIAFGYTGWGAGQLESEMAVGGWIVEPEDPALIFDVDKAKVWDEAMARRAAPP